MSGPTPGPWLFGLSNRNNEAAIIGDIDSVVCYLPDASTGCTFKPADARLIAGAPELLGALVELLEVEEGDLIGADFRHAINKAKRNARTAIAKATGAQP